MKNKNHIYRIAAFFVVIFFNVGCFEEHDELVPELEGVPAGGMVGLEITKVEGDLAELEMIFFVVDHFGGFISGLNPEDFTVSGLQNEIEFAITSLIEEEDEDKGPFSTTLLFDQSGSIASTDPQDARIEAGTSFARIVSGNDEAAIAAFTSGSQFQSPYELLVDFTNQSDDLIPSIEVLAGRTGGGTPLYISTFDLISYTANNGKNPNRAIVAFTDGGDTAGGVSVNELIQKACAEEVRIYTVGLGDGIEFDVLSEIAFRTGGAVMLAEDAVQLVALYNSLSDLLHGKARFYRAVMQFKRLIGEWNVGDQLTGTLSLPLSESLTINYPFHSTITTRQAGEWYERLPNCPCTYQEAQELADSECDSGVWQDCGEANQAFHYGAAYEVRWLPDVANSSGQQCTYNLDGYLITSGIAAGSPDTIAPATSQSLDILKCGNALGNIIASFDYLCQISSSHCEKDVIPWRNIPCWKYLEDWPANTSDCNTNNTVSGIQHMLEMVGDMTCEDITFIIKRANEVPMSIEADLRNYILGETQFMQKQLLISRLENWKDRNSCFLWPNDEICVLIDRALENLQ
ncbi:MAG: VWA domain-containing protein [Bacteroidota bacterium]